MAVIQQVSSAPPLTQGNLLVAVNGVHWETFGRELLNECYYDAKADMMLHIVERIIDECESYASCLKAVVDFFLKSKEPSWRKVIWALYKANAVHLAEPIRSYAEPLEDHGLIVDSVTRFMELVPADRMKRVWNMLDVPESQIALIARNISTPKEKTQAYVDLYLHCHPYASRRHIIRVLYSCGEMAAAKEANSFYYQNDPSVTVDDLVGVMSKVMSDKESCRKVWAEVLEWDDITPDSYLDEVYRWCTSDEVTHTLADVYVNIRPESSWQHLLQALYKLGEMEAAKEAKSFLQQNDPTLSIDHLVGVMSKVTSDKERRREVWEEVLQLDLYTPDSYVNEVYTQCTSDEATHTLADVYVNIRPESSWQHLLQALYNQGEMAAAKDAKSFLQQNDGSTLIIENVARVLEKVTVAKRTDVWQSVLGWRAESYVYSNDSTDQEWMFACSSTYVYCSPDASWEHLTSVLYRDGEMTAVDLAKTFLPPRDLTLTTDKLMKLFQSPVNIRSLGWLLDLPESVVNEIQGSFQNALQLKEAYLDSYIHQHPCPSWRKVASALRSCSLFQEADNIENTYVQVSERTQHNFYTAMAERIVMIRNGSVIFLGPGGSGKSHALAILLDEQPPSQRESTGCVQKPVRTITQLKVDVNVKDVQFVRIGEDQYSDMLSISAISKHAQPKTSTISDQPQTTLQPATSTGLSTMKSDLTNLRNIVSNSSGNQRNKKCRVQSHSTSGFDLELQRRMQAVPKSSVSLSDKDLLDMKDTGGQPPFLEVLPIFIENITFGILTVKLNESLHAYPLVEYYSKGNPIGRPFNSPFTHLQTFHHCMKVVQSTCKKDARPKFVFVGTHKDCEQNCRETREEKNQLLRSIIPPDLKDSILCSNPSKKELLFPMNVKTPRSEDKETAGLIRQMIIRELQSIPKRPIPLRYFALENAFLRLAKYQRKGILSKTECFREASQYHFTEESFDAALKYLHSLKLIFYYEEILPELVFTDAQIILDMITELIGYSLFTKSPGVALNIEEVKAYGIITDELFSDPQFNCHYIPGLFMKDDLILLLKYLWVLAEVGKGKYLVPCLLKVEDILRPLPHLANHFIPALLFYFGPDGPKLGVYCFLITSLITDAKWELLTENGNPVQIFRNRVQFAVPGQNPGCVTISDSFSTFFHVSIDFPTEVSTEQALQTCEDICPSIRQTILTGIRKASQKFNYRDSVPQEAFPCTQHPQSDLHPAIISSRRTFLTCTTHRAAACSDVTDLHKVWLGNCVNDDADDGFEQPSPLLDQVLDSGLGGVSKHLGQVAESMYEWEGLVADQLGLSLTDINYIKKKHPMDLKLQARAALDKWKQYYGPKATYRNLISAFQRANHHDFADNVCQIIGACLTTSDEVQVKCGIKDVAAAADLASQTSCLSVGTSPQNLVTINCKPTFSTLRVLHGKRINIIKRLSPHWTELGDLLEFDDSSTQLSTIKDKCNGDHEECCRTMFQHWLNGKGVRPCSWRKLIELLKLCDEEVSVLTEDIQAALSAK